MKEAESPRKPVTCYFNRRTEDNGTYIYETVYCNLEQSALLTYDPPLVGDKITLTDSETKYADTYIVIERYILPERNHEPFPRDSTMMQITVEPAPVMHPRKTRKEKPGTEESAWVSVWLHSNWPYLTSKMTNPEREYAADHVEAYFRHSEGDEYTERQGLRWWRK